MILATLDRPVWEVAEHLDRPARRVSVRRGQLGVGRVLRPWTAEEDAVVRAEGLSVAASLLDRSRLAVTQRRAILGVSPHVQCTPWTRREEAIALAAPTLDAACEALPGRRRSTVQMRRKVLRRRARATLATQYPPVTAAAR